MSDWKPRYEKIKIDLVPSTSFGFNLRSAHPKEWDIVRHLCYRRAGHRCEICGSRGTDQGAKHDVECHELWGYDYEKAIQKLLDLVALCPMCHRAHHLGFAEAQGKLIESLEHIKRVNKITENRLVLYMWREAQLVWRIRSKIQWKLDTSFVLKFIKLYGNKKKHKASWALN